MSKFETYWGYVVQTYKDGKQRGSLISGQPTLAQALAAAFKDACYYTLTCGYRVGVSFEERCKACDGSGREVVRTKVRPCKACKGKPVVQSIPETPWMTVSEGVAG